jgi:hypothetical protein
MAVISLSKIPLVYPPATISFANRNGLGQFSRIQCTLMRRCAQVVIVFHSAVRHAETDDGF